jgi:hypothetical protein
MPLKNEEKNALKRALDYVVHYLKDKTAKQYYFNNKDVSIACLLKMRLMPVDLFLPLFGPSDAPVKWPNEEAKKAFDNFYSHLVQLNKYYLQIKSKPNLAKEATIDPKEATSFIDELIESHRVFLMEDLPESELNLVLNNNSSVSYGFLRERFSSLFSNQEAKEDKKQAEIVTTYNTTYISYSL